MHKHKGDRLPQWLEQVETDDLPALHSLVAGLRRDLAAVTAGITLPWSSGAVEGNVNRIILCHPTSAGALPRTSRPSW
jgi:transposase